MRRPRLPRAALRSAAVAALVLVSALPGVPSAVAAAEDGIHISTRTTYTLAPDDGVVRVAIDLLARNTTPPTTTGGVIRRTVFPSVHVALQPEADHVRATTAGRPLAISIDDRKGYRDLTVQLRTKLTYEHSARLRVTFELPGGKPRSRSDIRVGQAFASFYAWVNGDSASVRIDLPDSFEPTISGATLEERRGDGRIVYTADHIDDPARWYAIVDADRVSRLRTKWLTIPTGESIAVRAWPEDREWQDQVADRLERGMPELHRLVGLPWPVTGALRISEVHTPLLEGYAGLYHTDTDGIEISEDLDDQTILHEASHAWFNDRLFAGRWISEGLAETYASKALSRIGIYPGPPIDYPRTDPAAFPLNDWPPLGRIEDDRTAERESYGYQTSFRILTQIATVAGDDGMRRVLAAANDREIAYVGAPPAETSLAIADWRTFLDYLEERGHATNAAALFRLYVVGASEVNALAARAKARDAYAAVVRDGAGWLPAYAIRSRMASWDFAAATDQIATAESILALRDRIAAAGAPVGLAPPATLRTDYEEAGSNLGDVVTEATIDLEAAGAIATATARAAEPRDPMTVIGLAGFEPSTVVAAARQAYASGDAAAARDSVAVAVAALDRAPEQGTQTVGGAMFVVVVIAFLAVVVAVRRRRDRRRPAVAAPGALWGPGVVPAATLPSQPSLEWPGPAGDPEPTVREAADTPPGQGPD